MNWVIKAHIASLVALFSNALQAQASDTSRIACWQYEYVKIGISDGVRPRHRLFASVPCKFVTPLYDAWKSNISMPAEQDKLHWDAFRYRALEQPGSHGLPKIDYLGESAPLSPRSVVIALTEEMDKELAAGKLYLDNTPDSLRHAVMIFKKGKPVTEVIEISKNAELIREYMKTHLVLLAFPENTGSPQFSRTAETEQEGPLNNPFKPNVDVVAPPEVKRLMTDEEYLEAVRNQQKKKH